MHTHILAFVLILFLSSTAAYPYLRLKRSGGKATFQPRIRPPVRLKKGETKHSDPGWKHCQNKVKAVEQWRIISFYQLKTPHSSQFQCTWFINAVRYDGFRIDKQIKISIQKLWLGSNVKGCTQQFLEIIDSGKTQGRFCEKEKPGDYVSIGGRLRIDIQVQGGFPSDAGSRPVPFVINYKTVTKTTPGFRQYTGKIKLIEYDRHHTSTKHLPFPKGVPQTPEKEQSDKKDKDTSAKEDENGILGAGAIASIAVGCTLVVAAILILILRPYCCQNEKEDRPSRDSSIAEEKSPPISSSSDSTVKPNSHPPEHIITPPECITGVKAGSSSSTSNSKKEIAPGTDKKRNDDKKMISIKINKKKTKEKDGERKIRAKSLSRRARDIEKTKETIKQKRENREPSKGKKATVSDDTPARRASKKSRKKERSKSEGVEKARIKEKVHKKSKTTSLKLKRPRGKPKELHSNSLNRKTATTKKSRPSHRKTRSNSFKLERSKTKSKRHRSKSVDETKTLPKANAHHKDKNGSLTTKTQRNSKRRHNRISTSENKENDIRGKSKNSKKKTLSLIKSKSPSKLKKSLSNGENAKNTLKKKNDSLKTDKVKVRMKMRYKKFSPTKKRLQHQPEKERKEKVTSAVSNPVPSTRYRIKSKKYKSHD